MKRAIIITLILVIASSAKATLQISVNGDQMLTEVTLNLGETLSLGIWTDGQIDGGTGTYFVLVADKTKAAIPYASGFPVLLDSGLMLEHSMSASDILAGMVSLPLDEDGIFGSAWVVDLPSIPANSQIFDGIEYQYKNPGNVTLKLYIINDDLTSSTLVDMVLVRQLIPEVPVAMAGPNQITHSWIKGTAKVRLDGSASYNPNADELTYLWQWSVGGNDYEANGVKPTIDLPPGVYTIELVVSNAADASQPDYVTITVLEPPLYNRHYLIDLGPGVPLAINNNNQIVGRAYTTRADPYQHAFLYDYTGGGANIDLGVNYANRAAYSINDSGRIVGVLGAPCLFDPNGGGVNTMLGFNGAYCVNNKDQVVGWAPGGPFVTWYRAIIFDLTSGKSKDLGDGVPHFINDKGQVVGWTNGVRALLFDSTGGGANLELGGISAKTSCAWAINNKGQIVGWGYNNSTIYRAILFDQTGGGHNIDLGTLGGAESQAFYINDIGDIIGYATTSSGSYHACLFDSTGEGNNIDLNTYIDPLSGWRLGKAYVITNKRWIIGEGVNPAGSTEAFLLVPEPAPVANAGPDQTVYAWIDGIAEVDLDGSASFDEGGYELTYLWKWSIDGNDYEANGVNPTIELPVGQHTIELVVNDGYEDSEPNYVVITVVEPIEGTLWIASKVIHRRCEQKRIMTILRLPESITRDQIDNNSMLLLYPGEVEAVRLCVIGGRHASIFGFFDRDEILEAIGGIGPMQVYVVGQLKTGQYFYGSDTMRIINPGRHRPKCNMREWFRNKSRSHVLFGE